LKPRFDNQPKQVGLKPPNLADKERKGTIPYYFKQSPRNGQGTENIKTLFQKTITDYYGRVNAGNTIIHEQTTSNKFFRR
jgi:hypothetical protein